MGIVPSRDGATRHTASNPSVPLMTDQNCWITAFSRRWLSRNFRSLSPVDGFRRFGTTSTDYLTIGDSCAHFFAPLRSYIEGASSDTLAMAAFVRLDGRLFLGRVVAMASSFGAAITIIHSKSHYLGGGNWMLPQCSGCEIGRAHV
jgi:hypothetical protein